MKKLQTNRAFTLIEILVVISIILVLSGIGIANYRSARHSVMLDLEADKLVVLLQNSQTETRAKSLCIEVKFEKNKAPEKREGTLQRKEKCDFGTTPYTRLNIGHDVTSLSDLVLVFIPPKGKIQTYPGTIESDIKISFNREQAVSRTVTINRISGAINRRLN